MNSIYFDNAATTSLFDEDINKYVEILKSNFANASSSHFLGVEAFKLFENAKKELEDLFLSKEVIFTSGATEANNLIINGLIEKHGKKRKHIVTSRMEHPSVLKAMEKFEKKGYEIDYIENYNNFLGDLKKLLKKDTLLVSLMSVNNETGIISDPYVIGEYIKNNSNAFYHCDATQSVGKINLDYKYVDFLSFSGHKLHSLKGVGFLLKKKNLKLDPFILGGGQQNNLRSGTINYPSYVVSSRIVVRMIKNLNSNSKIIKELNMHLKNRLKEIKEIEVLLDENASLYITSIYIKDKRGEVIFNALSNKNIYLSTKSACSSKSSSFSYPVYAVCNNKKIASNSLRISFSIKNTKKEIDIFINELKKIIKEVL